LVALVVEHFVGYFNKRHSSTGHVQASLVSPKRFKYYVSPAGTSDGDGYFLV